jgi:hypothetical protein
MYLIGVAASIQRHSITDDFNEPAGMLPLKLCCFLGEEGIMTSGNINDVVCRWLQ